MTTGIKYNNERKVKRFPCDVTHKLTYVADVVLAGMMYTSKL